MIGTTLLKTTSFLLLFYSFTASHGSKRTTAGRVVSACSIMVQHGIGSKEVKRAKKKNRLRQSTSHCCLPAKVMDPSNSTKCLPSWLIGSIPIVIVVECSNIYTYSIVIFHICMSLFESTLLSYCKPQSKFDQPTLCQGSRERKNSTNKKYDTR